MAKKKSRDFYSKPMPVRLGTKIFEGMISAGVVYLFSPQLLAILAPLQAQLNASAINNGQTPATQGTNTLANQLIKLVPNPAATTPTVPTTPT